MAEPEYYTLPEVIEKLGVDEEQLRQFARDGRLREFRFSGKLHFKASEIVSLAAELGKTLDQAAGPSEPEQITPVPDQAEDSGSILSLEGSSQIQPPVQPAKPEEKQPSGAGQAANIFDEEDLSGLEADPMAQTQIAPSLDQDLPLEGVGSGSGLLDLTKESDDTSLGAELLDEIYSEEGSPGQRPSTDTGAPIAEQFEPAADEAIAAPGPASAAVRAAQVAEPMAVMFSALMIAAAILLGFTGSIIAALIQGVLPGYVQWLSANILIWTIGSVAMVGAAAGVGFVLSQRQ